MFNNTKDDKSSFLKNAKLEREQRQSSKKKDFSIIKIQVSNHFVH